MIVADLHTHTDYSDGVASIEDLLKEASVAGIKHLAVTDHDTVFHLPQVIEQAKPYGIQIIPGLEMSLFDYTVERRVHMLGLFFPTLVPPNVDKASRALNERREAYHRIMIERFSEQGYPLTFEEVKKYGNKNIIYKMHIFMALYEKYLKNDPTVDLKAFYMEHFGAPQSKEDDALVAYPDIQTGIDLILADGGIPIIAHPNVYDSFDQVESYIEMGMQGIECFHPHMSEADTKRALKIAKKHNLYISGGTDFHGHIDPRDTEAIIGTCGLTSERWDALQTRVKK